MTGRSCTPISGCWVTPPLTSGQKSARLTISRLRFAAIALTLCRSDAYQTLILVLFVVLTLILSLALLNTLIAMFGATYANVMDQSQATWMLQRAELMLLNERVL